MAERSTTAKRNLAAVRSELGAGAGAAYQRFVVLDEAEEDDGEETASVYAAPPRKPGARKPRRKSGEIEPGITRVAYEDMRAEFEARHFYDICADRVVEVKNGELLYMKAQHAEAWLERDWRLVTDANDFCKGYRPFFKLWAKDPDRRCARRISRVPTTNPDDFYVPLVFAWESEAGRVEGEEEFADEQVALYCRLVDAAAASNPAAFAPFIHNYFAHMLQRPLDLPGVALILTGPKGCGKDTLLNFVLRRLLGRALAVNYDRVDALFNTHDTGSMHMVAVKVEELSAKSVRPFAKPLRALITAETRVFNTKNGIIQHNIDNYARLLATSNEDCPVPMYDDNQEDRRFFIARMSPNLTTDKALWAAIYHPTRGLVAASAGRAVGKWLMARDLSSFNPRLLPATEAHRGVYERSPLQTYVEDGWAVEEEWATTKTVWLSARKFCADAGIDPGVDLKDTIAVGRALAVYVSRGVVDKTVGHARTAYYKRASGGTEGAEGGAGGGVEGQEAEEHEFYVYDE